MIKTWQSRFESWKSNQHFQSINAHFDRLPKTNFEKKKNCRYWNTYDNSIKWKNLQQNEFCYEASITKIHLISSCCLCYLMLLIFTCVLSSYQSPHSKVILEVHLCNFLLKINFCQRFTKPLFVLNYVMLSPKIYIWYYQKLLK